MPDITISLTVAQATRLQDAFQNRHPSAFVDIQFVKDWIRQTLKDVVIQEEREKAASQALAAYESNPFEPT